MSVNLNMLNIDLARFNEAASGKHNIGQLKLGADGASVVRTNNHKHWTIFNNTEIRPEESLAIKNAFCKALSREGLSDDKVGEIRMKLGIGGSILDTLKAGNIKPLSAAEVREIIDEVAGDLNKSRAPGAQLRTSAQIYRGVSAKTLAARKTDRDQINADTVATMETRVGGAVGEMVDLLEATGKRPDFPAFTKNIAREICRELQKPGTLASPGQSLDLQMSPITLKHDASGTIVAKFRLDDGRTFSVGTNLTKEELRDQMNKVLYGEVADDAPEEAEDAGNVQPNARKNPPRYGELIDDLKRTFDTARDTAEIEKRQNAIFQRLSQGSAGKKFEPKDLKTHALHQVREKLVDSVVDRLVEALRNVRGMDPRNARLVNQVRDVIYGDQDIDADALVEEISDVLHKERVDFKANIGKNDPLVQQIEDNFDENLNIDALLGNND
jgi:hypothetical protein